MHAVDVLQDFGTAHSYTIGMEYGTVREDLPYLVAGSTIGGSDAWLACCGGCVSETTH